MNARRARRRRTTWNAARRRWVYTIVLAAVPLLVAYDLVTAEAGALWAALVAAVLGVGLAHATDTDDDDRS